MELISKSEKDPSITLFGEDLKSASLMSKEMRKSLRQSSLVNQQPMLLLDKKLLKKKKLKKLKKSNKFLKFKFRYLNLQFDLYLYYLLFNLLSVNTLCNSIGLAERMEERKLILKTVKAKFLGMEKLSLTSMVKTIKDIKKSSQSKLDQEAMS